MNPKQITLYASLMVMLLTGCKDEPESTLPAQPELPPENAFIVDMSDFGTSSSRADSNYKFAATNVGVWNTLLFLHTALPIKAWEEVRQARPEWDRGAEAWTWTREFSNTSGNYTASLHGFFDQNQVIWRMYVSKQGFYKDFLWYGGKSNKSVTQGSWRIFRNPDSEKPYLDIAWVRTDMNLGDEIKYTNVKPNDPANGSYIHFGFENELLPEYPMYYDIYDAANDRLIEIDYDNELTSGRVRDSIYFDTYQWKCWDENHSDIVCE